MSSGPSRKKLKPLSASSTCSLAQLLFFSVRVITLPSVLANDHVQLEEKGAGVKTQEHPVLCNLRRTTQVGRCRNILPVLSKRPSNKDLVEAQADLQQTCGQDKDLNQRSTGVLFLLTK
jgi:hypothetical protein